MKHRALVLAIAAAALVATGCGDGSNASTATPTSAATSPSPSQSSSPSIDPNNPMNACTFLSADHSFTVTALSAVTSTTAACAALAANQGWTRTPDTGNYQVCDWLSHDVEYIVRNENTSGGGGLAYCHANADPATVAYA